MKKVLKKEKLHLKSIHKGIQRKVYMHKYFSEFKMVSLYVDKIHTKNSYKMIFNAIKNQHKIDTKDYYEYHYERMAYKILYIFKKYKKDKDAKVINKQLAAHFLKRKLSAKVI